MAHDSFGAMVDRVAAKIKAHVGWDDAKLRIWWDTPNPVFGSLSPGDFLMRRPDKFERVVDALISGHGP